ncbi:hypothetical protein P5673_015714 [Acropora cervicornis]|uniref:Uncharacterized protein n=1 Tax=Acropora cervicornis TaxID=6130 RepID=A0AAD9V4T1_ACRCE|nr:hypothetical protein P5673_015714 [Acropora cervicornis]
MIRQWLYPGGTRIKTGCENCNNSPQKKQRHHPASNPTILPTSNMSSVFHLGFELSGQAITESTKRYQNALDKIRDIPQVQLLPRLLQELHDMAKDSAIAQTFQVMSMSLMIDSNDYTPALNTKTAVSHPRLNLPRHKTKSLGHCKDLRKDPYHNKCLGLCGPKCWCWSLVCDDCCFHRGCYEHDLCCSHNKLSAYCLLPFFYQFKCKSYGGFPECLSKP